MSDSVPTRWRVTVTSPGIGSAGVRAARGRRRGWVPLVGLLAFVAIGCPSPEIPGSYDVEIELFGAGRPIGGALVLSRSILDVPAPSDADRALLGEWVDDEAIDANSCFILESGTGSEATPRHVELIAVRFRDDGLRVPFDVIRTPSQRIEVTGIEFFASTLGGDVVLHDEGETREGRIHGTRVSSPAPRRCVDALLAVRAERRASLAR